MRTARSRVQFDRLLKSGNRLFVPARLIQRAGQVFVAVTAVGLEFDRSAVTGNGLFMISASAVAVAQVHDGVDVLRSKGDGRPQKPDAVANALWRTTPDQIHAQSK